MNDNENLTEAVIEGVTVLPEETVVSASVDDSMESKDTAAAYTVISPDMQEFDETVDTDPVMVDVITSILGEYRRQTYTVEQYDTNGDLIAIGTEYVPGLAGLDWPWITGAIFFAIVLSAGFKLLGGLIRS